MTKKQFDDLYKHKAVHCDTEEKANEFLSLANSLDYKWVGNISLLNHNNWEDNKEKTCYYLGEYGLQFTKIGWYYENGYEVIEYQSKRENDINDIIERINEILWQRKEPYKFIDRQLEVLAPYRHDYFVWWFAKDKSGDLYVFY